MPLDGAFRLLAVNDPHDERLLVIAALTRIVAASAASATVDAAVAQAAGTLLPARVTRVWVNDADRATLTAGGSFGVDEAVEREFLDTTLVAHGTGIPGRIAQTRTAEFLEDARDDGRWVNRRYIRALGLRAYAGLPLVAGEAVVGVLSVMFDETRAFTESDRRLMQLLGDHAAVAMQIARRFEEAELHRGIAEAAREHDRLLFERNCVGRFRSAHDGRLIACNAAFARLLGHRGPGDLVGRNTRDLFVEPTDYDRLIERLDTGGSVLNQESRWKRVDGGEATVLLNVTRGQAGAARLEGVALDVSDRTRAAAAERAAAELDAIAKLARAAAHEINNPLTVVMGQLSQLSPGAPERHRIDSALQAALRIEEIVRRMSRIRRVTTVETAGLPPMLDIRASSE